ncbi:TIGR00730 family Rossman fold protein [Pseudorhodoplanes sp.]|uniref:LOG family protein n=1 Tax=Pseudorhodoplanes sp. TaxID=1934341 RepID=UPI002CCF4FF4|nr:TIGR00730 family Rossman fold protein [Pseudorhodoplanes sp.]HWV51774.1 TIGR00730 family Rossman fold protein [Pseudorhodoplanes sp.]
MSKINKICVYCGSGLGSDPGFAAAAEELGQAMAAAGIGLVYGGGNVGLMGTIARSVLNHGGEVIGIIPEFLMTRERALRQAHELIVTANMHERKQKMFDAADAFVALPGGVGTLEELVEQLTWAQLGQHKKPILLANINGFWDPLSRLLDHMRQTQFIRQGMPVAVQVANTVPEIIPMLQATVAGIPEADKQMDLTPTSKM